MSSPNSGSERSEANLAFKQALQRHLDKWKSDPRSFPQSATPESLRSEVAEHTNNYQNTRVYLYTSKLSDLINRFNQFFNVVDIFVSSNPTIAALVWGGIRFIMKVCGLLEYQAYIRANHSSTSDCGD